MGYDADANPDVARSPPCDLKGKTSNTQWKPLDVQRSMFDVRCSWFQFFASVCRRTISLKMAVSAMARMTARIAVAHDGITNDATCTPGSTDRPGPMTL